MSRISKLGRVLIAVGTIVLADGLHALTIDVQKARKDAIQNKGEIVTNVTFDLDLPYGSIGNAGLVQPLADNSTNQSGIVFGDQGTIYINADPAYGLYRTVSGKLAVSPATWEDYEAGTSWYKPITPALIGNILAPFTVKSVKRNGTVLTPDANGAVDISVPTKLNDVCPETENWIGVPGTTAAGKSIKILAKTVNGVIEGGLTVTGSSNNDNNTTKYRYNGVTVTREGTAIDYLFDNSQYGIARLVNIPTIYDWAKASTKPSYTWTEIVNRPTNVSSFNNDAAYVDKSVTNDLARQVANLESRTNDWNTVNWSEVVGKPSNVSSFNNDVNYIKLTEFKQAIRAAVTNSIPVITDNGDGFTEEDLVKSINEIAGALNRLRAAALVE